MAGFFVIKIDFMCKRHGWFYIHLAKFSTILFMHNYVFILFALLGKTFLNCG